MRLLLDDESIIFMDGAWIPWQDAKIHVLTHALHYATSVYEGIRVYETTKGRNIFRLNDHTKRFINSAKIIRLNLEYSLDDLADIQKELVRKNNFGDSYIRPLAFHDGQGFLGFKREILKTRLMIANFRWKPLYSEQDLQQGVNVVISSFQQFHPNTMLCKAKAGSKYLISMLAKDDALRCNADDAILLDTQGFVTECTTANIFMLHGNTLTTPPAITALNGITRQSILTLAEDLGYKTEERLFTRDELYTADEVFKTGTACEIVPIVNIDDRMINTGKPGETYLKFKEIYNQCVYTQLPQYKHWNTLVTSQPHKETTYVKHTTTSQ